MKEKVSVHIKNKVGRIYAIWIAVFIVMFFGLSGLVLLWRAINV